MIDWCCWCGVPSATLANQRLAFGMIGSTAFVLMVHALFLWKEFPSWVYAFFMVNWYFNGIQWGSMPYQVNEHVGDSIFILFLFSHFRILTIQIIIQSHKNLSFL